MPGGMELALILLIAVLLFGANKIPKLARSTGQAMGEFQRGREEIEDELQNVREGGSGSTDTEEADVEDVESVEADAETESTSNSSS